VKLRCERDVLADALGTAARAATGRAGSSATPGVRLDLAGDDLTITGTDHELTIQVTQVVHGDADGSGVLQARLGADIVRSLEPGKVTLDADADEIRIASGRSEFRVRALPVDAFARPAAASAAPVTLEAEAFAESLRQVVRAASSDSARQILTGVLLTAEESGLRMVATDSYRLAIRDLEGSTVLSAGQKVLVPSRALNELGRLLPGASELVVRLGEREVTFEVGNKRLTTLLIDGEFPNYRQLVPSSYPNKLRVGREALLDAVRRLKPLTGARDNPPVRLRLSPDSLDLTVTSQELGTADESIDASYEGSELTVAFNAEYLSAGVDAVAGDEVLLETIEPMKPAVVRSAERSDYLYLLMPVRVP
jgi:DNA polymerase III subunit beta